MTGQLLGLGALDLTLRNLMLSLFYFRLGLTVWSHSLRNAS